MIDFVSGGSFFGRFGALGGSFLIDLVVGGALGRLGGAKSAPGALPWEKNPTSWMAFYRKCNPKGRFWDALGPPRGSKIALFGQESHKNHQKIVPGRVPEKACKNDRKKH